MKRTNIQYLKEAGTDLQNQDDPVGVTYKGLDKIIDKINEVVGEVNTNMKDSMCGYDDHNYTYQLLQNGGEIMYCSKCGNVKEAVTSELTKQ